MPDDRTIKIGNHLVGPDHRPFVIAEMSGNHNGDLDRALAIVDAVAASGAQALKLQTYTPDTITIDVDAPRVPDLVGARPVGRARTSTSSTSRRTRRGSGTSRSSSGPASAG